MRSERARRTGARAAFLLASALAGCGSSPGEGPTTETTIVPVAAPSVEAPSASAPATSANAIHSLPPTFVEPGEDPDAAGASSSGVADICSLDPSLCTPVSQQMVASCRCSRFRGRDAQRCLIECIARERAKVNEQLKQLGP